MRDEQNGGAGFAPQSLDQALHSQPRSWIERAERFIHQQDLGPHDERLSDGYALLHAARKLVGIFPRIRLVQIHTPQIAERLGLELFPASPPRRPQTAEQSDFSYVEPEGDVLKDSAVGEERIFLRHVAAATVGLRSRAAFHQNLTARGHFFGQHQAEQRRFSAPGLPDDRNEFARRDVQVDPIEDFFHDLSRLPIFDMHVLDANDGTRRGARRRT